MSSLALIIGDKSESETISTNGRPEFWQSWAISSASSILENAPVSNCIDSETGEGYSLNIQPLSSCTSDMNRLEFSLPLNGPNRSRQRSWNHSFFAVGDNFSNSD